METPFTRTVHSQYGAPMGRDSHLADLTGRCHLARVRLDSGGYDKGGAYWGRGQPLFCAWDDDGTAAYLRAPDREGAKRDVLARNPAVSFYR